ncbi:hypothetical protein ACPCSK_34495 [Streptomyces griseoincarnatus]
MSRTRSTSSGDASFSSAARADVRELIGQGTGADGRLQVQIVVVQVGQEEQGQGLAGVAGVLNPGRLAGPAEGGLVAPGVYAAGVRVGEGDGAGEEVVQAAEEFRIRVVRLAAAHGGGVFQDGGEVQPAGFLLLPELAGRALLDHLHHAVHALVPVQAVRLLQRLTGLGDGLLDRPRVGIVRQHRRARVLRIGALRHDPIADQLRVHP